MSRLAFLGWSIGAYAGFLACIIICSLLYAAIESSAAESGEYLALAGIGATIGGLAYLTILGWAGFRRHKETGAADWLFVAFIIAMLMTVMKDIYTTATGDVLTNAMRVPFWVLWLMFLIWPKEHESLLWRKAA